MICSKWIFFIFKKFDQAKQQSRIATSHSINPAIMTAYFADPFFLKCSISFSLYANVIKLSDK